MDQQTLIALMRQDLQDRRAKERARAEERAQRRTFEGTSKGRGLSTSPTGRPSKGKVPAVSLQRGGPAGEIIHTSATSDSVATGGDYLVADTELDRFGFEATTLGDTYTIPRTANYYLKLQLAWDSYLRGGTFEVQVNGTTVANGTVDAGGLGDGVNTSWGFRASKGDTVKVKVTQSSGSAQAATWTLTLMVAEPLRSIATPGWVQVASIDAQGITQDGTGDWWGSEGGSGATVTEYDSNWSVLSSFESHANVRGVTWDGTHLWICDALDTTLRRYTTGGVLDTSFAVGGTTPIDGVAWDGTDLWVVSDGSDDVRRYTAAGVHQQTISLPASDWGDLAFHDGKLWIADSGGDRIAVYTTSGTHLKDITTAGDIDFPTGVYIDGSGNLYACKDDGAVYRWGGGTV